MFRTPTNSPALPLADPGPFQVGVTGDVLPASVQDRAGGFYDVRYPLDRGLLSSVWTPCGYNVFLYIRLGSSPNPVVVLR